jgi:uncharacterized delta-60 repeat protein
MRKIIFFISFLAPLIGFAQDGSLDDTYDPILDINMNIEKVMIQSDDKIIIQENLQPTPYQTRITRLMTDGSVDFSFNCELGADKPLTLGAIQSDGKILLFQNDVESNTSILHRLNTDGSVDDSFMTNGTHGLINSVVMQPDGKIVLGGTFDRINDYSTNRMVRLENDGRIDPSFKFDVPSLGVDNVRLLFNGTVVVNDGKFLVNNHLRSDLDADLIRINSDGSPDTEFMTSLNCLSSKYALQSTGKIIVRDNCVDFGGGPLFPILYRLNSDGTYDNTYLRFGFDSPKLSDFMVQADDKIIVTGAFTSYDDAIVGNIIRLNPDGKLDITFDGGAGPNNEVWDMVQQSDGKIIMVGLFSLYNNIPRNHIVRLNSSTLSNSGYNEITMRVYPNPVADNLYIEFPHNMNDTDINELEIYDVTMKRIEFGGLNKDVIDVSDFSRGVYLLKFRTDDSIFTSKFVKK